MITIPEISTETGTIELTFPDVTLFQLMMVLLLTILQFQLMMILLLTI